MNAQSSEQCPEHRVGCSGLVDSRGYEVNAQTTYPEHRVHCAGDSTHVDNYEVNAQSSLPSIVHAEH